MFLIPFYKKEEVIFRKLKKHTLKAVTLIESYNAVINRFFLAYFLKKNTGMKTFPIIFNRKEFP